MSKSLKAALLSALVFPGSGHFLLGKRVRAVLLAGVSLACLFALVFTALEIAQEISAKLVSGEIPLDATRLTEEISRQSASSSNWVDIFSTYLILVCWLVSIVDSYRLGRLQDRVDSPRN